MSSVKLYDVESKYWALKRIANAQIDAIRLVYGSDEQFLEAGKLSGEIARDSATPEQIALIDSVYDEMIEEVLVTISEVADQDNAAKQGYPNA